MNGGELKSYCCLEGIFWGSGMRVLVNRIKSIEKEWGSSIPSVCKIDGVFVEVTIAYPKNDNK